jgi:hypothetical protein
VARTRSVSPDLSLQREALDVDQIDHACDAVENAAAVLHALAESKATGETAIGQLPLWFGIRDMTKRMLESVDQIREGDTRLWGYVDAIEGAGKGGGAS